MRILLRWRRSNGKKEQGRERRIGTAYGRCILREIKGSFGRFIAIIGIVALGVGFLLGILSTTRDLKASMSQYYTEKNYATRLSSLRWV